MLALITTMVLASQLCWGQAVDDPEALVVEALERHPSLHAHDANIAAAEVTASAAGAWSDPMAAVEYSNVPVAGLGLGGHPMAGLQLRVQQTLPLSGTPGAREDLASSHVVDSSIAREQRAQALALELRGAYWELARVRQDRALTERHITLLDDLMAVVRARYETGAVAQHSLLELELRRARLQDALGDRDRAETHWLAVLNAARHAAPDAAVQTPVTTAPVQPDLRWEGWLALAKDHNPGLDLLEARAETARLQASLARAQGRVDPSVWAGYRLRTVETATDPGMDLVSLGLSVPIPTGSGKTSAAAATAAEHRDSAIDAQRSALEATISTQLASAEGSWTRATTLLATTRDTLVPSAQRTLDAVLTDFRVGRASFDALIRAELELLELERSAVRAAAETQIQQARVLALIGAGAPRSNP